MFNYGGGAGPGNSAFFQGALSRGVDEKDMNRLIEVYKEKGRELPSNLNPIQNPTPIGTPTMGMIGNVEGMRMAHGIHTPTTTINGVPRYLDKGSHDPNQHKGPVDPSGREIKELVPKNEDIPLYGMPRTLSGTTFPVGNYVNKTVS